MKHNYLVFAGTYNSKDKEAIHTYRFHSIDGTLEKLHGTFGIENPSYITLNKKGDKLFAVSEVEEGSVVAYGVNDNGSLTFLNKQPTDGSSPCYVSLNKEDNQLFVVNYMGGSIAKYSINQDGRIEEMNDSIQYTGSSRHPERQEAPHPHSIVSDPHSGNIFVADLGTDYIHIYVYSIATKKLVPKQSYFVSEGAGPRHIRFHPTKNTVYVVDELTSKIEVLVYDRHVQRLTSIQTIDTLPKSFKGENTAAELKISPSGNVAYCSNRGHDSIAIFDILEDGTLKKKDITYTNGLTPRHFTIMPDEDYILVAHQDSDSITVFKMDKNGLLSYTGKSYSVTKPVCLQVLSYT